MRWYVSDMCKKGEESTVYYKWQLSSLQEMTQNRSVTNLLGLVFTEGSTPSLGNG